MLKDDRDAETEAETEAEREHEPDVRVAAGPHPLTFWAPCRM